MLSGCFKYSFTGNAPSHLHTIAVPTMEDRTSEFGLRENLTDALIAAFRRDNTLNPSDEQRADAILTGTILNLSEAPYTYNSSEIVSDTRVTITAEFKLYDRVKNKVLFEGTLTGWGTFKTADGGTAGRQTAVDIAVKKLADDVVNKTLSGW